MTDSTENVETKKEIETGYDESEKKVETTDDTGQEDFDDLGYPVPKAKTDEKKEDEKPKEKVEEKKSEDEEEGLQITGYDKEPEVIEQKEKAKEENADDEKDNEQKEVDLGDVKDLLPSEVESLKKVIKDNKLDQKTAKALVDYKKQEVAELNKALETRREAAKLEAAKLKKQWFNELKNDSDFGGEKFDFNVKRSQRVIKDYLPNLKNKLTEGGVMLPPYIMKDLAKLAGHLYSSEKMIHGEPKGPSEEESSNKEDDALAFYKS